MSESDAKPRVSAATQLAQDIARTEKLKPKHYQEDAKSVFERGRAMGLSNAEIEELFGIRLPVKNKSET